MAAFQFWCFRNLFVYSGDIVLIKNNYNNNHRPFTVCISLSSFCLLRRKRAQIIFLCFFTYSPFSSPQQFLSAHFFLIAFCSFPPLTTYTPTFSITLLALLFPPLNNPANPPREMTNLSDSFFHPPPPPPPVFSPLPAFSLLVTGIALEIKYPLLISCFI